MAKRTKTSNNTYEWSHPERLPLDRTIPYVHSTTNNVLLQPVYDEINDKYAIAQNYLRDIQARCYDDKHKFEDRFGTNVLDKINKLLITQSYAVVFRNWNKHWHTLLGLANLKKTDKKTGKEKGSFKIKKQTKNKNTTDVILEYDGKENDPQGYIEAINGIKEVISYFESYKNIFKAFKNYNFSSANYRTALQQYNNIEAWINQYHDVLSSLSYTQKNGEVYVGIKNWNKFQEALHIAPTYGPSSNDENAVNGLNFPAFSQGLVAEVVDLIGLEHFFKDLGDIDRNGQHRNIVKINKGQLEAGVVVNNIPTLFKVNLSPTSNSQSDLFLHIETFGSKNNFSQDLGLQVKHLIPESQYGYNRTTGKIGAGAYNLTVTPTREEAIVLANLYNLSREENVLKQNRAKYSPKNVESNYYTMLLQIVINNLMSKYGEGTGDTRPSLLMIDGIIGWYYDWIRQYWSGLVYASKNESKIFIEKFVRMPAPPALDNANLYNMKILYRNSLWDHTTDFKEAFSSRKITSTKSKRKTKSNKADISQISDKSDQLLIDFYKTLSLKTALFAYPTSLK